MGQACFQRLSCGKGNHLQWWKLRAKNNHCNPCPTCTIRENHSFRIFLYMWATTNWHPAQGNEHLDSYFVFYWFSCQNYPGYRNCYTCSMVCVLQDYHHHHHHHPDNHYIYFHDLIFLHWIIAEAVCVMNLFYRWKCYTIQVKATWANIFHHPAL